MADLMKRGEFPLTEWDPFRMMREMMRWDPFRSISMAGMPRPEREPMMWIPDFEVRENGNAIRFIADLPGIKRSDVEVTVTGNRLTISGHRESEERKKDEMVHTYERSYGQFTRVFTLPDTADLEHVTSDLRDGVLTVAVPTKGGSKTRKIAIGGTAPKS